MVHIRKKKKIKNKKKGERQRFLDERTQVPCCRCGRDAMLNDLVQS